MGTFATTTSLQTLLPGVTFDNATTSLCSMAITWAEGYMRTALSRRYNMSASPFNTSTSIPTALTSLTEQMAMGQYFKLSSRGAKEAMARGQALIDEVKRQVKEIRNFEADLLDNSFSTISSVSRVTASVSGYHTTFNEDDPLNWKPDSDKLLDIADERL